MVAYAKDRTGYVYGRLTVIQRDGSYISPKGKHHSKWLCECSCGNIVTVVGTHLQTKNTTSCGCAYSIRDKNEGSLNSLYLKYKDSAKRRGLPFTITQEEFKNITVKDCTYCGKTPSSIYQRRGNYTPILYNGVDRIDNTLGYIQGNVTACCTKCNKAKGILTQEEFFDMVKKIYEKHLRSE